MQGWISQRDRLRRPQILGQKRSRRPRTEKLNSFINEISQSLPHSVPPIEQKPHSILNSSTASRQAITTQGRRRKEEIRFGEYQL
jgi:hypothetical protein